MLIYDDNEIVLEHVKKHWDWIKRYDLNYNRVAKFVHFVSQVEDRLASGDSPHDILADITDMYNSSTSIEISNYARVNMKYNDYEDSFLKVINEEYGLVFKDTNSLSGEQLRKYKYFGLANTTAVFRDGGYVNMPTAYLVGTNDVAPVGWYHTFLHHSLFKKYYISNTRGYTQNLLPHPVYGEMYPVFIWKFCFMYSSGNARILLRGYRHISGSGRIYTLYDKRNYRSPKGTQAHDCLRIEKLDPTGILYAYTSRTTWFNTVVYSVLIPEEAET